MSGIISLLNETFNITRCIVAQYVTKDVEEILLGFLAIVGLCSCVKFFLKMIIWLMCPILVIVGTVLTIMSWRNGILQEYLPDNMLDSLTVHMANNTISSRK